MSESPQTTEQSTDHAQVLDQAETTTNVDWAALWEEFGFDTPDAAGNEFVSDTALVAALQSTDQPLAGDAEGHIDEAVDDGVLVKRYDDAGTLRGYSFVGGER